MPAGEVVRRYKQHRNVASDVDDDNIRDTHRESGLALEILPFRRHTIDAVYLTLMSTQNPKYLKMGDKGDKETEQ